MRYILLALFAVGCGASRPLDEGTSTWSVTLGSWETPTCEGTMKLSASPSRDFAGQTDLAGTWTCGTFGQQASGQITPEGRAFLDLETTPGFLNHVRGTLEGDNIAGDILLDGQTVPFAAYRQ